MQDKKAKALLYQYPQPAPRFHSDMDVHIWYIDLDSPPPYLCDLSVLTKREHKRASGYADSVIGRRWQNSRAGLRWVLGRYLNQEPSQIRLSYSFMGKPQLFNNKLSFNISHSHSCALIAVGQMSNLGIDIEHVSDKKQISKNLSSVVLCEAEQKKFRESPPDVATEYFYRLWVRKEAVLKANGCGLSLSPAQVSINQNINGELEAVVAFQRYHIYDLPFQWPAALAASSKVQWRVIDQNL